MEVLFFVAKIATKLAQMSDVKFSTTHANNFVAFFLSSDKKGLFESICNNINNS